MLALCLVSRWSCSSPFCWRLAGPFCTPPLLSLSCGHPLVFGPPFSLFLLCFGQVVRCSASFSFSCGIFFLDFFSSALPLFHASSMCGRPALFFSAATSFAKVTSFTACCPSPASGAIVFFFFFFFLPPPSPLLRPPPPPPPPPPFFFWGGAFGPVPLFLSAGLLLNAKQCHWRDGVPSPFMHS